MNWTSSKAADAAPIIKTEGIGTNGALQLLADRYAKRLERIFLKAAKKDIRVDLPTIIYYNKAEAAVRALYADAT